MFNGPDEAPLSQSRSSQLPKAIENFHEIEPPEI